MAWVAFDRAIRSVEEFGLDGPAERWHSHRERLHEQVCREGFDPKLNSFVQSYGAQQLDASLLLLPLVGFLPADDPRIEGTVATIERSLLKDGFVARYNTGSTLDGLPGDEGAFLACSFWLADNYILQGRHDDARALFDRLLAVRNDVGLLAEEYDPGARRQVGNFPQAFSHVALINTAHNLTRAYGPFPSLALHRVPRFFRMEIPRPLSCADVTGSRNSLATGLSTRGGEKDPRACRSGRGAPRSPHSGWPICTRTAAITRELRPVFERCELLDEPVNKRCSRRGRHRRRAAGDRQRRRRCARADRGQRPRHAGNQRTHLAGEHQRGCSSAVARTASVS